MIYELSAELLGFFMVVFIMLAFAAYIRIVVFVNALDEQITDPPARIQISDKLRAYRNWCREHGRRPWLLIFFAIGVFGAVLCWTPLPWLLYH